MRERPIKDLTDGLKQLGVDINCSDTGCPPVSTNERTISPFFRWVRHKGSMS